MSDIPAAPPVTVVLTTAPDAAVAESLATALVHEGLAACVNIVPGVTSIFRWEGEVQREAELLLVTKTTEERVPALCERIVALHPYDVPEMIALPVTGGHAAYLDWVRGASGGGA